MGDIEMTDKTFYERGLAIGARIRAERKAMEVTQGILADKIAEITGDKLISQNTISDWERGITIPPLNKLLALSKIFRCDCGYLLCDYDERTHGVKEICSETGLSAESVEHLRFAKTWGIPDASLSAVDFLFQDHYTAGPRSILSLIYFFLAFDGKKAGKAKRIYIDGSMADNPDPSSYSEYSFSIASNRVIENAVLEEIKENLKYRKREMKGEHEE